MEETREVVLPPEDHLYKEAARDFRISFWLGVNLHTTKIEKYKSTQTLQLFCNKDCLNWKESKFSQMQEGMPHLEIEFGGFPAAFH